MEYSNLLKHWAGLVEQAMQSDVMKRFNAGDVGANHYISYLIETYHNTKLNPQLQALSTYFCKNMTHEIMRMYYRHAMSEVAHDELAINDLVNLGIDKSNIYNSRPLPETLSLNSIPFYGIMTGSHLCYLAYLFHLEHLPTIKGSMFIDMLSLKGVPDNALTFLKEHAAVDYSHNKLMQSYVAFFIKSSNDIEEFYYYLNVCSSAHFKMIEASILRGDKTKFI